MASEDSKTTPSHKILAKHIHFLHWDRSRDFLLTTVAQWDMSAREISDLIRELADKVDEIHDNS